MATLLQAAVSLDYGAAATRTLLRNLSGVAASGDRLWTVSDEGRTVECLRAEASGYVLSEQLAVDDLQPGLPGAGGNAEMDLESIDISDGRVWICGSHCRVRREAPDPELLSDEVRARPSRHILASFDARPGARGRRDARFLATDGGGSLRHLLRDDPYLAPFLELPSKENGLDIEGVVALGDHVLLGLRGPLLDSIAAVLTLRCNDRLEAQGYDLSLLDLGGLAVRDLTRSGDDILVLAGPVSEAAGPFSLHRWRPLHSGTIEHPALIFSWPQSGEKPEGICPLSRDGRTGLLVLYDKPDRPMRINGSVYLADWLELP